MDVLNGLEAAVRAVAERTSPAVVGVGAGRGSGSGVVVSAGHVVTNAHNVRGAEVTVTFHDGRTAAAHLAGIDVDGDLAVLDVDTAGTEPVAWRDGAEPIGQGAVVFAVANPGGRGTRTTFGTVSAVSRTFRGPRGRRISGGIEHTAPLARGSSGGPVVDSQGRLVGLNTHRLGDGFYLALTADAELRDRLGALEQGESPARPRLGLALAPAHVAARLRAAVGLAPRDGLLVRDVEDDGPAADAGIRAGDLIVEAAGQPVADADALFAALAAVDEGASLTLGIVRGTEEHTVAVSFGRVSEEGSA
ncbi:hypothetical protein BH23ACT8_BH23ACT8_01990 [soil metagenome]